VYYVRKSCNLYGHLNIVKNDSYRTKTFRARPTLVRVRKIKAGHKAMLFQTVRLNSLANVDKSKASGHMIAPKHM